MSDGMKSFAAVATFAEDEAASSVTVPSDMTEVRAKIDEIVAKYGMGDALSEEDKTIVKAYLPAIGSDTTEVSPDNALVGMGAYSFEVSELGCDLKASGNMGCKGTGEGRIEWWADMSVAKAGGDTRILGMKYTFGGVSFGTGPSGVMKVIYKREFSREFEGVDASAASFDDRYTFTQWGYYFTSKCEITTDKGTIVVA